MKFRPLASFIFLTSLTGAFLAGNWWAQRSHPQAIQAAPVAESSATAAIVEAAPAANQASVKEIFRTAKTTQDLPRLLQLLRSGSKLTAQGQIATEVAKLDKTQVLAWLKQMELLPNGDPIQEALRSTLIERWAEVDLPGMMTEASKPNSMFFWSTRTNQYQIQTTAFRALANKNPQEAWEKAKRMGQGGYAAKQAVLSELAISNPEAGLKLISDAKNMSDNWAASNFFQAWAGQAPDAAAAAVDKLKNPNMRSQAMHNIASIWAKRDPAAALAWADSQGNLRERNQTLSAVLGAQAETNPQEALANLQSRKLGGYQNMVTQQIMNTWANNDFDAALTYANGQKNFAERSAGLSGVIHAMMGDESRKQQILTLAETLPNNLARQVYQTGLFSMVYSDPEKMQDWIGQIKQPSIKESVLKTAVDNQWYGMDQAGISKLYDQLQPTSQSPDSAAHIASGWALEDTTKALEWATKITNVESQKKAVAGVIDSWADKNPTAAAAYVKDMPAGEVRDEALSRLAQSWVSMDPKAAQAWANSLTGDEQSKVLGAMVTKTQEEDPENAPQAYAKFAASLSPEAAAKKEHQAMAKNVASNIAQDDPQKAITWMETLPAGGAREQAIGGIADSWISFDPAAASEWITKLPAGEGRDTAAGKLATTIARDDPAAAFVWATSISDAAERRNSAASVVETWKKNGGKEAARSALEAANFTEPERAELLKKLE